MSRRCAWVSCHFPAQEAVAKERAEIQAALDRAISKDAGGGGGAASCVLGAAAPGMHAGGQHAPAPARHAACVRMPAAVLRPATSSWLPCGSAWHGPLYMHPGGTLGPPRHTRTLPHRLFTQEALERESEHAAAVERMRANMRKEGVVRNMVSAGARVRARASYAACCMQPAQRLPVATHALNLHTHAAVWLLQHERAQPLPAGQGGRCTSMQ